MKNSITPCLPVVAAPGEVPAVWRWPDKCERNFEFVHSRFKRGPAAGQLDMRFGSREPGRGFYGQLNVQALAHLVIPDWRLNRRTAERIVDLFLAGAAAKKRRG